MKMTQLTPDTIQAFGHTGQSRACPSMLAGCSTAFLGTISTLGPPPAAPALYKPFTVARLITCTTQVLRCLVHELDLEMPIHRLTTIASWYLCGSQNPAIPAKAISDGLW